VRRTHFDFWGASLLVEADSSRWIDLWERLFPEYHTTCPPKTERIFHVVMETRRDPAIDHDLPLTWRGRQPDGFEGQIFEMDERLVMQIEDAVAMTIDYENGIARVYAQPDGHRMFQGSAVMQLIDASLGFFDRCLVHAAALIDRRTSKALLLSVKSGGGKTTTSLALARNGFALMTDDAAVVGQADGIPCVWGLKRPLKVHRRTAEMLPWVGPMSDAWDEQGEQPVALGAIADRMDISGPEGAPLGAIMEIGARTDGASTVYRIAKSQALIALAHENVGGRALGLTPRAQRRFSMLARTVAATESFMLRAGGDLDELPRVVAACLDATGA
jgi:hypothetical protein